MRSQNGLKTELPTLGKSSLFEASINCWDHWSRNFLVGLGEGVFWLKSAILEIVARRSATVAMYLPVAASFTRASKAMFPRPAGGRPKFTSVRATSRIKVPGWDVLSVM